MIVNEKEARLVNGFRRLPPEAAQEIFGLIERLANISPAGAVDWSDEWSDEDLRQYTAAAIADFDSREAD